MKHTNAPIPASSKCGLLLVEGGDERAVCRALVDQATWAKVHCWQASGREDLPPLGALAARDPNFANAQSIGILLDAEDDFLAAQALAIQTVTALGGTASVERVFSGTPRIGFFIAPELGVAGCIETLCKRAVRSAAISTCVDSLVACVAPAHVTVGQQDKAWLKAYSSMLDNPNLRFHQVFDDPQGIDPAHMVFDQLKKFLADLVP
jgi:hypothetical protein